MTQALGALQPTVRIVEEPAAKELRFRYECECRSVGSIPGVNSTKKNPTFPTIRVENFTGQVTIVVSCVTQDQPYRPHPHSLVGRDGCEGGVCTIRAQVTETANEYSFKHLGIQCCRRNDIKKELLKRALMRVNPFGKLAESIREWQNINLKAVRLVFQVFLHDSTGGDRMFALEPAVSNIIYDKKIANLRIVCAIGCSGPVSGGTHIGLLCEKVTSDDTVVIIYEKDDSERVLWETTAKVVLVHKQVAIVFELPPYNPPYYKPDTHRGQIKLNVQLKRISDKELSNSVAFEYIPDFQGAHKRPKRVIPALLTYGAESPAPTYSQLQPAVSHSETQTVGKGSSLHSKLSSNQTYTKATRAGELSPFQQNGKSEKSANKSHLNGVETTNAHGSPRKKISSLLDGISDTPPTQETIISAHSTQVEKRLSTRRPPLSTHCPPLGWGGRSNSVHNSCLRAYAPQITKVAKVAPLTCSTQSNHNVKPNETVASPSNLGPSTVAQYMDGGGGISTAQRLLFDSQFVHSNETNQTSPVHGPPMYLYSLQVDNLDEMPISNEFSYNTPSKNMLGMLTAVQISINNSQLDSYVSNTDKIPFTYGSQLNSPSSDVGGVNSVFNMYQQPVDIHCNNEILLSVPTSHNNTGMGDHNEHMSNIAETHLPYEAPLNPNLTNMGEMNNLSSVYGLPYSENSQHTQKNYVLTSMHTTTTSSDTQNNGHRLHQHNGDAGLPANRLPLNSYSTELRKIDEVDVPSSASSIHLNQTCRPSMLTPTVNIGHEGHTMYPNKTPSYDPPVGARYQNFDEVRGASSARTQLKEQSQRPQETNTSFQSMNHQMEIESEEIVLLLNEETAATLRDLSRVFSQDNCESLSESLRRLSTGNDNSD